MHINGLIEAIVKLVTQTLLRSWETTNINWDIYLLQMLTGLRTSCESAKSFRPFQLFYGKEVLVILYLFIGNVNCWGDKLSKSHFVVEQVRWSSSSKYQHLESPMTENSEHKHCIKDISYHCSIRAIEKS